jgi:putative Ca2+/H+ antiporter (TMEM165/GDT1 family)
MHPGIILIVFGVIFIAELPDKSFFAALILGSRYKGWYVWLGAATAFLIHVVIAVAAGKLLTLLPHRIVEAVIAALFLAGALLLFFGKHGLEEHPLHIDRTSLQPRFSKVFATAFSVTFLGEWGDITQITTANYAARYHAPLSVGIGAVAALWAVSALAITAGSKVFKLGSPKILQRITAGVLFIFALLSAYSAIK